MLSQFVLSSVSRDGSTVYFDSINTRNVADLEYLEHLVCFVCCLGFLTDGLFWKAGVFFRGGKHFFSSFYSSDETSEFSFSLVSK